MILGEALKKMKLTPNKKQTNQLDILILVNK